MTTRTDDIPLCIIRDAESTTLYDNDTGRRQVWSFFAEHVCLLEAYAEDLT